ncbi:hypothetical protein A2U01_0058468, partial [Trifolium medium]|nr:hypothetical protein [Trifolium medium]
MVVDKVKVATEFTKSLMHVHNTPPPQKKKQQPPHPSSSTNH